MQDRLIAYHKELEFLGIRDYHVPALNHEKEGDDIDGDTVLGYIQVPYQILRLVLGWVSTIFTFYL